MVVPQTQCPSNFYGSSLPRPRFYTDVKFNDHRVDPPLPVTDPFMSWAQEAHWAMGGLSFKRLRLQGKIEGNVNKLRSQREAQAKAQAQSPIPHSRPNLRGSKRPAPDSPLLPPAPVASKRRRLMALIEEEEEEEENKEEDEEEEEVKVRVTNRGVRRRLVKKLGDDFDRVASQNEGSGADPKAGSGDGTDSMAVRTRKSRRLVKVGDAVRKVIDEVKKTNIKEKKIGEGEKRNRVRTSPRLAKSRSN